MVLGIELGSTRIKAVLLDEKGNLIVDGAFDWENKLVDGFWTYSLEDVEKGIQASYKALKENYFNKYNKKLSQIDGIGISAMMHGYLPFDKNDNLLVNFRTWRNTNTSEAQSELTKALNFNMPQRWSATHYYQAVLNNEDHIHDVAFLTTLAGYVHFKLTNKKVLGIGDASGMFPILNNDYDAEKLEIYDELLAKHGVHKHLKDLLPKVLVAGENAGSLTKEGALFLDPTGDLNQGSLICPPEGDVGTGLVATNTVEANTGSVSAGTSAFVMIVLDKPLKNVYPEIDIVTTPTGLPVAMVHVNNCTSEINAWVNMLDETLKLFNTNINKNELYTKLFEYSLNSDAKVGDITTFNFLSGEPVVAQKDSNLLISRKPDGLLNLANFMQSQIYSAVASLSIGMELIHKENVIVKSITGHGGFFKTDFVGQNAMSAALNVPVTVLKNAGEGGAFGIAQLALYALNNNETLQEYLNHDFENVEKTTVMASEAEINKFNYFMKNYKERLK